MLNKAEVISIAYVCNALPEVITDESLQVFAQAIGRAVLAKASQQVHGEPLPFIPWSKEREFFDSMQTPKQEPVGTNRYGLDMSYMVGKLNIFIRDIDCYKGDEAARILLRLAKVADESVFNEPEFSPPQAAAIPTEQQILSVAKMVMPAAYLAEENYKICSFAYAILSASPKPEGEQ